jgi:hypothetical protein
MVNDYQIPEWVPGGSIVVEFDDKTAAARHSDELGRLIYELRSVANKYDFDLQLWGTDEAYKAHVLKMEE